MGWAELLVPTRPRAKSSGPATVKQKFEGQGRFSCTACGRNRWCFWAEVEFHIGAATATWLCRECLSRVGKRLLQLARAKAVPCAVEHDRGPGVAA